MTRVLTGITTSGTPHLGNYVGAVRPAIAASRASDTESFYFLADLHSLIKSQDPARTQRSTLEIAATWLAAGLDPEKPTKKPKRRFDLALGGIPSVWLRSAAATTRDFL